MPVSGGAADKLGNRYEALWAIDQLLRIVDGAARWLTLEPLNPDEARGIEFVVGTTEGTTEYWSVKRQTTKAAGWTLALLASKDDRGRTILGDLLEHVEKDPSSYAVFASTLGAGDFEELRAHTASKETLEVRPERSAKLNSVFRDYVLPLCGDDMERALAFLRRTRTHAADEAQLSDRIDFTIRKLLCAEGGSSLDAAAVRGQLKDVLHNNIHSPLDKEKILGALRTHGVRLRETWEKSVKDRIDKLCEAYVASLNSSLVNGTFLPLAGAESILGDNGQPIEQKVLVVGGAGGGKSTTLADIVKRLRVFGISVLPVRFDQLPEGILSTTELGHKLLLPESPALTLEGVASGAPCVLVVDQLDAVSIASGRRAELWSLFEELLSEIEKSSGMSLIVGCREFDLEHDQRMRTMKAETSDFAVVNLRSLTVEQVDSTLRSAGTEPSSVPAALKSILAVPLHLSMFLSLTPTNRVGVRGRDDLFDRFWTEGERRVTRRLGRKAEWTQVIDKLTNELSRRQDLSAPQYVLGDFSPDAEAIASEHILSLSEGRYRFFHESFFDYAFARRFVSGGGRLIEFLLADEQHLFRRGQVRQVLAYLRSNDRPRYLEELENVIASADVRFHIKSLVFQWLSSLADPQRDEWKVIENLLCSEATFLPHIHGVVKGHLGWFDVLDSEIFFEKALSSDVPKRQGEAIWLLSFPQLLERRSARVATLLRQHRDSGEQWRQYLRYVCRADHVHYSREMFDLFLELIDDGTLDDVRLGFAVNDDWWDVLYLMSCERPDMACEAIGRWFDRAVARWRLNQEEGDDASGSEILRSHLLSEHLDQGESGVQAIHEATQAPLIYVEQLLPRVARFVNEAATDYGDRLKVDPFGSFRSFGEFLQTHSALLSGLATSLETLAITAPADLDRLLEPYQHREQDTIAYLVLRAWTAAPQIYAERLADFLVTDSRRLKVGYTYSSGIGGSQAIYTSAQAVRAASAWCSAERFVALENAILSFTNDWEAKNPSRRGWRQLELLESLDKSRLSMPIRAKLDELQRKFPERRQVTPRTVEAAFVGSPISEDAEAKMSDEHWLRAMRKYKGVDVCLDREGKLSGGEHELAGSLETRAKIEPERFAALAERMPDNLPAGYFDAILRGVASGLSGEQGASSRETSQAKVVSLIRRVHALPGRPCGSSLASLIESWKGPIWPDEVVDTVVWYAFNDPDPDTEAWTTPALGGQPEWPGDPYTAGINSTRGAIAGAIARLLFNQPEQFERLQDAVYSLANDESIAVRCCAIEAVLAVLNLDVPRAISWFLDCISADSIILGTLGAERFIRFAGYRDFTSIHPVIEAMLGSTSPKIVEVGARRACLFAFDVEAAEPVAQRVRSGASVMRKAAAEIYSINVSDESVGPTCRQMLKPFFADSDDEVRAKAASAFRSFAKLSTTDQADLLAAFLDAVPGKAALRPVACALEDSPVQLPDLVCLFAEQCVDAYRAEVGDISKAGASISMDLAKIVVRLYAQTEDRTIQSRCLNLIDEMEKHHFMGLSDELRRLDR